MNILYLTTEEDTALFDKAASEMSMTIHKAKEISNLSEFIKKTMQRYTSCSFFVINRRATMDTDKDFMLALESVKIGYDARLIVIYENEEGKEEIDAFMRGLLRIGVSDIITATDETEKYEQFLECLSPEGMVRFKVGSGVPKTTTPTSGTYAYLKPLVGKGIESEQYRFDCANVTIGIIGATRRVGTTSIAFGLASYINEKGGTACYVALNVNMHLNQIAEMCELDKNGENGHFSYQAIDFFEAELPKRNYNFVIVDYGAMDKFSEVTQAAMPKYKRSIICLLCGASNTLFEIEEFADALESVRSSNPHILTINFNPKYKDTFSSSVSETYFIANPTDDMLDAKTNENIFREILEEYIVETSKRF